MEYQVYNLRVGPEEGAKPKAGGYQWRFIDIYQAILNTPNLNEHELFVLRRLVEKRSAACQQRLCGVTAIRTS